MGANITPTPNSSGRTVLGVRMGCHAFRRCWRKAVSVLHNQPCSHASAVLRNARVSCFANVLGGLRLFCFLSGSSFSRILLESVCSMVCDMLGDESLCVEGEDVRLRARCGSLSFLSGVRQRSALQGSLVGLWQHSATTALHRRAANCGGCVLFGTKWNADFNQTR